GAWLRDRRHLHPRGDHHPARRDLAADAGDPDVPAVRGRDHRLAPAGSARNGRRRSRTGLMRPAGFLQRCAAWTLDAAVLAPAALAIAWPRLHAAGATWGQGLGRVGERLGEAALAGMPPRDLPALLLRDPVLAE